MRRTDIVKLAGAAALALLAGVPAAAQPAPPAPASTASQSNLPYDITADHGEVFNEEGRAIYTGDVVVIQGQDRLNTPQLTIFFAKKGQETKPAKAAAPAGAGDTARKIERMEAIGPVYFTTPTQNAKGDHGTYLKADDTTTLIGNVVLVQDKNVSTGDKVVFNKTNDHAVLYSTPGSHQRVRGVFYQDDQKAAAPGTAPKTAGPVHP